MRSTRCATSCRSRPPAPELHRACRRCPRAVPRAAAECAHADAGDARWIERLLQVDEEMPSPADVYLDAADLMADLLPVPSVARGDRARLIADGRLTDLLRRVSVFGVTLAPLDIRQDAARHTEALVGDHVSAGPRAATPTGTSRRGSSSLAASSRAAGRSFPPGSRRRRRRCATCSTPSDDRRACRRGRSAPT